MKSIIVALMISTLAAFAQADVVDFEFVGFAGVDKNFNSYEISSAKDGKLKINFAGVKDVVAPKLVSDLRGTDGPLELDLGQNRILIVTSGFSMDGVSYFLKLPNEQIRLIPLVFTSINNKGE